MSIHSKIIQIRGQWVLLDFDLAQLYGVETKKLNQAVQRNLSRFPADFMFRINKKEWSKIISDELPYMRSQSVTASQNRRNISALPYAFTEQGIAMLSSVLRSDKAIKMNIAIMRIFIQIRQEYNSIIELKKSIQLIKEELSAHDHQLDDLYNTIEQILIAKAEQKDWEKRERIGFILSKPNE